MNKNLTDITIVLDRSGSIMQCREEFQKGLDDFIAEQKKCDGECVVTLIQFDNEYDFVYKRIPIHDVPQHKISPRGTTALLDAIGRGISETGERLSQMDEASRPGLVTFVILTDGFENASREFNRQQIHDMIQEQREKYNWQFVFLGANQDAIATADSLGVDKNLASTFDTQNSDQAFCAAASSVTRMRRASSMGASGKKVLCCGGLTDEERTSMRTQD